MYRHHFEADRHCFAFFQIVIIINTRGVAELFGAQRKKSSKNEHINNQKSL